MKKVLIGILAVIGAMAILAFGLFVGLAFLSAMSKPTVPSSVILEANFEAGVLEAMPHDGFAQLLYEDETTLRDVLDALERGAEDRRVKAFVARIGGDGISTAHIQEIRDAVLRFRESGKPTIAWAETFGEVTPGNASYLLATAFDEIYIQPSGMVGLIGLQYVSEFWAGLYEKLDIEVELGQRYEYKNAVNSYTHTEYTEPHREALGRVMESRFEQIVRGIAEERGFTEQEVRELIDRGPFLAQEALDAGLVDELLYRDEVLDRLREEVGTRARLLYLKPYITRASRPNRRGTTVALIQGHGVVTRGASGYNPWTGQANMGSDTIAKAFRDAIDDDRVEAILFRVNSPGGSPGASDTIWHETVRAREAGKPVIVSMGNVAGSGGYMVAMAATKIVAEPGTITGSIGVYGGKMVAAGMWNKIGITFDELHTSRNAGMMSGIDVYSESERARLDASLDHIYEDFTSKVAEGRNLPLEQVLEIARGRIWTGEDALEIGLVDALGGYDVALDLVREELDLEPDAPLRLKLLPRARSPWEALFGQRGDSSERVTMRALARTIAEVQPYVRTLERAGLGGHPGSLTMPLEVTELD